MARSSFGICTPAPSYERSRDTTAPSFALAFDPHGKFLASASGDRTVKLWDVATGERLETFGQPLLDQYTVAFSPDGQHLAAAGADNRIRIWRISATGKEGTNPIEKR